MASWLWVRLRIALLLEVVGQPSFIVIIAIGCISGVQSAYHRRISVQPAGLSLRQRSGGDDEIVRTDRRSIRC
jgi:hypothetical protein